jgi:hypothetical protein
VIAKANGLKKFGIFDFISIPIYILLLVGLIEQLLYH